jgi:hypothetical protein
MGLGVLLFLGSLARHNQFTLRKANLSSEVKRMNSCLVFSGIEGEIFMKSSSMGDSGN